MAELNRSRSDSYSESFSDHDGPQDLHVAPKAFRIYLVGFPDQPETTSATTPLTDTIPSLIPEALVRKHNIYRYDAAGRPRIQADEDGGNFESEACEKLKETSNSKGDAEDNTDATSSSESGDTDHQVEGASHGAKEADYYEVVNDDVQSTTSFYDLSYSRSWIEKEALDLLDRIQRHGSKGAESGNKVVLAGFGLGGIVVKQAIVIANTAPRFYDVASNVTRLLFFATPHDPNQHSSSDRSSTQLTWQHVMTNLLEVTDIKDTGRFSQLLSSLVESVSRLSHSYYRFAAKYPKIDFVQGVNDALEQNETPSDTKVTIRWPKRGSQNGLAICSVNDLKELEILREHFAPREVLGDYLETHKQHHQDTSPTINDNIGTYFDALQSLSPSRWILYEGPNIDRPNDFNDLDTIYQSVVDKISWDQVRGGVINICGPSRHGKSTLVQFISQKLREQSSVVTIDNQTMASEGRQPTLYGVLVSCIHQLLSQKPSLFEPVIPLMAEINRNDAWTETNLESLLCSMFLHCRTIDFLIVVHDLDVWEAPVQDFWLRMRDKLAALPSAGTCTFLIKSRTPNERFNSTKRCEVNLGEKHQHCRRLLITAKTKQLLDFDYGSTFISERLVEHVESQVIQSASNFDGSFSAVTAYLEYLLQKTGISSIQHIEESVANGPRSQRQLYEKYIERLSAREPSTVFWAKSTMSWILLAARTFRIEELAIAVSINLSQSTMSDIQRTVSMDMERDIRSHLGGLVSIQARHVRIASPSVAEILLSGEPGAGLWPESQGMFAQLCLHYLKVVLGNSAPETWDKCLALASRRRRWSPVQTGDSILDFLDYACRFWPTHFLAMENEDDTLRDAVINFFRAEEVSQKWFQLYVLFSAESNGGATTEASEGDTQFKSRLLGQYFFADSRTQFQLSPARMAGFVGLKSVVSALLEGDMEQKGSALELAQFRRGYLEHDIILWGDQTHIQFHCAVCRNDKSVVETLLQDDPEVFKGLFPLHRAALAGNFEIFQLLFKSYEIPSDSVLEGRSILHAAAISGHVQIARLILDGDTPNAPGFIDMMDNNNQTALMIAVRMGNIDLAKQLIAAGAQLGIGDRSGKTALHYSIQHCPQIVGDIVSEDSSLTFSQDEVGCTPLHAAACSGSIQTTEIMLAAAREKDQLAELINMKNSQDFMALHHAAERGFDLVCKVLIEASIEVDAYSGDARTGAALLASKHGHLASLRRIFSDDLEDGDQILLEAARAGQMLIVQYLLKTGVSADGPEEAAKTPLSEAAARGHRDVVRTLLRFGADVNLQDAQRRTPLHYAAMAGMHEVAEILLNPASVDANETNIDARDFQRFTPLHNAARGGNERIVTLLLRHNASVDARTTSEETPLHFATRFPEVVHLLLKHHASVGARTTSEETPLHFATPVPEVVKLLLEAHAEVNAVDVLHQAPLHMATRNQCHQSVQMLLKAGADVRLADDDGGKRAVYHAIEHKDLPMVEDLYKLGDRPTEKEYLDDMAHAVKCSAADVLRFLIKDCGNSIHTKKIGDDQTLLHVACETIDSPEIVSFLIESGLDVNSLGASRTPLHLAAARAKIDSMLELFKYGADVNMLNQNGDAPLHLAAQSGSDTAVRMLLEEGAPVDARGFDGETPLFCAVTGGHIAASRALVESDADCNKQTDTNRWSILHAASYLESPELLKFILSREVDVDPRSTNGGWTPLSEAIYCNRLENARLFLEAGADPNIENDESSTSLHVALENDNLEITRALLSHQGKWPVQPLIKKNGRSFIHIAAETCSKGIVQLLLESGADYTSKTTDGSSCLTLAIKGKHADNLKLFLDRKAPLEPQLRWEIQDIEDAYWLAVSLNQTEFVGIILDYDDSLKLLNKENKDGLDALQLALQSASPDYDFDEKPLPVYLVNRGIDPWVRKQLDRPSRFVQGLFFGDLRRKDFVEACIKVFPTDPRRAGLGFEELRAATEFDNPSLWEKLSPLLAQFGDETDQDGWNIHHFLSQSAPRTLFAGCHQESAASDTKAPTAVVRADMSIGVHSEPRVQISEDGLQVVFSKMRAENSDILSIRADHPLPPRTIPHRTVGRSYFEVSIDALKLEEPREDPVPVEGRKEEEISTEPVETKSENPPEPEHAPSSSTSSLSRSSSQESVSSEWFVSIGLSGTYAYLPRSHVGWNPWTVGYHSDDGAIYEEDWRSAAYRTGSPSSPNSTVGCGVDYDSEEYFFTLNGKVVGRHRSPIIFRKLYPTIAHGGAQVKLTVNFGQTDFMWSEVPGLKEDENNPPSPVLERRPTGPLKS